MRKTFWSALLALGLTVSAHADVVRLEVPNGWYAEAQTNGTYAVALLDGPVVTDHGTVPQPAPGDRPLYVRSSRDGVRFAGQSQAGAGSWEWTGSAWRLDPNPAFGVSGLIYDAESVLRFAVPGVTGSQGFRYVDDTTGRLVTGDETYSDPMRRIFEFTTHGEVTIGQGLDGCIALTETDMSVNGVRVLDRRLIEPGDCRFVRFNRHANQLAVAMVKLPEHKTVLLWLTVDDLQTFPVERMDPTPVPGPVEPAHPTEPQTVPDDSVAASAEASRHPMLLQQMRAGSDACDARRAQGLSTEQCEQEVNNLKGHMTRFIAFAVHRIHPEWGLREKMTGAHSVRFDGVSLATDVLMWRPNGQIVDVVSDRGTGWGMSTGDVQPVSQWVEPVPEPDDQAAPLPTDDVAALKARVASLETQLARAILQEAAAVAERDRAVARNMDTQSQLDAANATVVVLNAQVAALAAELQQLKSQPPPSCEAKVPAVLRALGIRVGCVVK